MPDVGWGTRVSGQLAVTGPQAADHAPQRLNAFVHGTAHPDLRRPFRLAAWFADSARLVLHLNSVSSGALLAVRVDGTEILRRSLPDKDGQWLVNNEYNEDIAVPLPAGQHLVEIRNAGNDWFYLDWIRLEHVRPSKYGSDWSPAPAATGIRRESEALVYLVAPGLEYPAQATVTNLAPSTGLALTISNLPAGNYAALWFRTDDGREAGRTTATAGPDGTLALPLPPIVDDLVGHLVTPPTLRARGLGPDGAFHLELRGLRSEAFALDRSDDLPQWVPSDTVVSLPPAPGDPPVAVASDPAAHARPRRFYRLRFDPTAP